MTPKHSTSLSQALRAATPAGSHTSLTLASQQIRELQERVDTITSKLLASDRENSSLRVQLETERHRLVDQSDRFAQEMRVAVKEQEIVQQDNIRIRKVSVLVIAIPQLFCIREDSFLFSM